MLRPRLIALVGPTAAGKTATALALAPELGAEIVSVDSRQVFRGLDVGTAKPTRLERAAVTHHLLDMVGPQEFYDAARFAEDGRRAITGILARGRTALLCGGSGLYLRALTAGLCPAPPADPAVRAAIERAIDERGLEALRRELAADDPEAVLRIASRDRLRLVRALEVLRLTGRPISAWQAEHRFADRPWEVATFVLSPPTGELDERIRRRTVAMFAGGILEETRASLDAGVPGAASSLQSIGYREAQLVLRGEWPLDDAVAAATFATRRYAKRQRTWFRGLADARWLDPVDPLPELRRDGLRFLEGGGLHAA